jgi:hypothetical protein
MNDEAIHVYPLHSFSMYVGWERCRKGYSLGMTPRHVERRRGGEREEGRREEDRGRMGNG